MKEAELEEITFENIHNIENDCQHKFKRLFFIPWIPDYGEAVHDARVKKCFKCNLVLNESE